MEEQSKDVTLTAFSILLFLYTFSVKSLEICLKKSPYIAKRFLRLAEVEVQWEQT